MPTPISSSDNARRWLHMIRTAEGAGYDTAFSGRSFDSSRPHPGTVYRSPSGYASAAHGAYQFKPDTWKEMNGGRNAPMTPANQDQAALRLMQRAGVNPNAPITREGVARLSGTWASLPTLSGKSAYGQPVKSFAQLQRAFDSYQPPSAAKGGDGTRPYAQRPAPARFEENKLPRRYQPNSSVGPVVVAPFERPALGLRDPVKKGPSAGFTPQSRPSDLNAGTSHRPIGGLPGLGEIAQAAIGNISYFKGDSSRYGAAAAQLDTARSVSSSYGTSLDLGHTLDLGSAASAAASGGYTWGATAGAASAWRTGFGF